MSGRVRAVSVVPTYMLAVVILLIAGSIVASVVTRTFLPLGVQRGYLGGAVAYEYRVEGNKVIITLANTRDYDAKVDVLLLLKEQKVLSSCTGYMATSYGSGEVGDAAPISLLGVPVRPREIVDIVCYESGITGVKVLEYGVTLGEKREAYIGPIRGGYEVGEDTSWLDIPGNVGELYFRIPVTVVTDKSWNKAYVVLELSPSTLPQDVYNFIRTHTRPDLNDMVVIRLDGKMCPTSAVRESNRIVVTFKVENLEPGVTRFYLYFGNPDAKEPVNPLNENPPPGLTIRTRNPESITGRITSAALPFACPCFLIPESNDLPEDNDLKFPHTYYGGAWSSTYSALVNARQKIEQSNYEFISSIVAQEPKPYPAGSQPSTWLHPSYKGLKPKTVYGDAPWFTITAVPLPRVIIMPGETGVKAKLWVSSDDGSAAYFVTLSGAGVSYNARVYYALSSRHGPSYWNYIYNVPIDKTKLSEGRSYVIILQQNGVYAGSGPGWIDFRFAMWYVDQLSEDAPGREDFIVSKYLDVVVKGLPNEDYYSYAVPIELTGANSVYVDWNVFTPESVYVVDEHGNPLYYWVQVADVGGQRKVVVWVHMPVIEENKEYKIRIYYGGANKYPEYGDPEKVFSFFDDFSRNPMQSSKWLIRYRYHAPRWDSNNKYFVLIDNTYGTGVVAFMILDWRSSFHVQFRAYISGSADGLTFAFFKDIEPYRSRNPSAGGSLALDYCSWQCHQSRGYAVEFDIHRNSEPYVPHIALVETFSSRDVSDNTHHKYVQMEFRNRWITVDIKFYSNKLEVWVDGAKVFEYSDGIFQQYGIVYSGIGFTAATGGSTGVFIIDDVLLRSYSDIGRDPEVRIIGGE